MYTVGLYTLGCKVAQYETQAIAEGFERAGFTVLSYDDVCDFYVVNTCTVTAESDRKCRQVIRRAARNNPDGHILVCGCYSQLSPDAVAALPGVSAVIGNDGKSRLVDIAQGIADGTICALPLVNVSCIDDSGFEPMRIQHAPRTRAYVKIEDGCDSKCAYCAIKNARGHIRSKPMDECIKEIEALAASGTKEIVLTGIEIGSYGKDISHGYGLADLILELDRRHSCERIRIGSLAPELADEKFADKIKGASILCPHFHISVQSGSDSVLARMKRRYNSAGALAAIARLRAAFPNAQFTTDLMVGFPGETEEEFSETLDFVRAAGFLDAHVFCYSRRKGTAADTYPDQVPEDVKLARSHAMSALVAEIRDGILDRIVGEKRELDAIIETTEKGVYTAHTASYIEVHIPVSDTGTDMRGKMVKVIPVSHKNGILTCNIK